MKKLCMILPLVKIVDGKVMEWFAIDDYLGLYMQLGMELKLKEKTC